MRGTQLEADIPGADDDDVTAVEEAADVELPVPPLPSALLVPEPEPFSPALAVGAAWPWRAARLWWVLRLLTRCMVMMIGLDA